VPDLTVDGNVGAERHPFDLGRYEQRIDAVRGQLRHHVQKFRLGNRVSTQITATDGADVRRAVEVDQERLFRLRRRCGIGQQRRVGNSLFSLPLDRGRRLAGDVETSYTTRERPGTSLMIRREQTSSSS
jgi:hypothetical protein